MSALSPRQFDDPSVYHVHPDEVGFLATRDFGGIPLKKRPWERSQKAEEFDSRVKEIMESAQHEGIREPLELRAGARRIEQGHHRWEAARRLNIEVPVRWV